MRPLADLVNDLWKSHHYGTPMGKSKTGMPALTEKQFQRQVIELALLRGWRYYHTYRSTRSVAGFPDLVLVRPPRLIFAELKREGGRVSEAQGEWIYDLKSCMSHRSRLEVYLWRPSHWDDIARTLE